MANTRSKSALWTGSSKSIESDNNPNLIPNPWEPTVLTLKKDRDRIIKVPDAPRALRNSVYANSQNSLIHSRSESEDSNNSFNTYLRSLNASGSGRARKDTKANPDNYFRQTFKVLEYIGAGCFGDVFHVLSRVDKKEYAVKKSRRIYSGKSDRISQLNEVLQLAKLPTHNNIVQNYQAWEEMGVLYIQMELCDKSLSSLLEEGDIRLTEANTWLLLIDMLNALKHLCKFDIVHLDVKPDNILLSKANALTYKLGDFGVALNLKDAHKEVGYHEGDSRYLDPEVMRENITTKCDVFSLGMSIIEAHCLVDLPKSGYLWHAIRYSSKFPEPCEDLIPELLKLVIRMMINPNLIERPEAHEILTMPSLQKFVQMATLRNHNVANDSGELHGALFEENHVFDGVFDDGDVGNLSPSDEEGPVYVSTPISAEKREPRMSRRRGSSCLDVDESPIQRSRNLMFEFEAAMND